MPAVFITLAEVEETRRRKTNIIIHGLQEPTSDDQDEHEQDENNVEHLLHELKCDDVSVTSIVRLGRRPVDEDTKPRPLKVIVLASDEDQKDKVLKSVKKLEVQGGWAGESVHASGPNAETETKRKELVEELKARQSQGEQNLIIVKDKIVTKRSQRVRSQEAD